MITNIQKYPTYKDSEVEWLDKIPNHWQSKPLFTIGKVISEVNCQDKELLSVYLDRGVIKFSDVTEKRTNVTSEDLSKYQAVTPGNLVLNNQQAWRGSVGVSKYSGIVSPAYIVLSLSNEIDYDFANYLFRDSTMVSHYLVCSKGVGTIQRNLYWPQLKRANVCLPPHSEQTAIADFLDRKTALIDQAIAIKQNQIELLKERRQILIHKAVTRGLNPNVKLKDSGVEWIGEIPEGWIVTSVKNVLEIPICDGPHTTPQLYEEGYPFVSAEAIKNGEVDFDKIRGFISLKDHILFSKKYSPKRNDIYMVKSGATTGNVAMVRTDIEFSIWSPLAVFRANQKKVIPNYLLNYLESPSFRLGVELSWSFGTQQNIGMGILSNLPIAYPSIEEQTVISEYIGQITEKVKSAISLKEQEIEKLKEYKATLINSAVTGKIKVN
jgi:type I restriction enzyme S subunit